MLRTEREEFIVHGVRRHHIWLEVLRGDDKGMRLSVPRRHESYSSSLEEAIERLEVEDVVEAVLKSDSEPPNWRVDDLRVLNEEK